VTRHVLRAVRLSSGNIKRAASALGVSRGKVYKHLRQNPPDLPDSQATG